MDGARISRLEDAESRAPRFRFDNSYARLPERFFARLLPSPASAPRPLRVNEVLARQLGLDPEFLASPAGVSVLSGNSVPEGAEPIALAYAGHQFGNWVPQLGDGRAVLLGEVIDRDGARFDIQLKGAGRTPFSRNGDGRAALGPVLREYIVSEAMSALGIPTTRTLAAVTTGEEIVRERPLPGAVLTRVARSHVRIGTFEYFANRGDTDAVRDLADYVIARLYPHALESTEPYRALLDGVIARTAELVSGWMLVGFIHGVMNTDNMSIAGETIDYGPCAFMDTTDPATVFSSIDRAGRYAYANQPHIAHWNLVRFAQALLPLLGADETSALAAGQSAIDRFPPARPPPRPPRPQPQAWSDAATRRRRSARAGTSRRHGVEQGGLHADLQTALRLRTLRREGGRSRSQPLRGTGYVRSMGGEVARPARDGRLQRRGARRRHARRQSRLHPAQSQGRSGT